MGRISISCLLPASWHFSLSPVGCPRILGTPLRQLLLLGAAALLLCSLLLIRSKYGRAARDRSSHRNLSFISNSCARILCLRSSSSGKNSPSEPGYSQPLLPIPSRLLGRQSGLSPDSPFLDPCLPLDARTSCGSAASRCTCAGTGDFQLCRELLRPLLNRTNGTRSSLNGVFQPPVRFQDSEFYGFSEFYYCTEDVLRMGGDYSAARFTRAAKEYCATRWSVLRQRFERGLYASHADLHRLKFQCFKSAWMFEVFHRGFSFPESYGSLKTALQVYDKEVQWTLGAILYRTRFLPLRDIQQENFRGSHSHWRSFSFVYNHHLFSACFLVVLLSILLYLLRLRRIHRRLSHGASSPALWIPEKIPIPQKIPGPL
ncbi:LOW QUALITY PROTEIN: ectonucleoside triphosphate diphosphohydrolase 4 [Corvus cornix cornix]|uniref:LOW QUALITY PROTEIN: ectonucleoside triphosphate diphosphohydrolase 4 n=1 Tax=Corvus cornix cornix TaxID=932674 RepID=UPI00194F4D7D|nr:LOW QUALITY PROTEIN: ectonucleoside triphosphate diphosphohydrolase 4 [Corvus cornix cornix]